MITFAVCFMLACVMLISGNGNIGEVKNSIQDTLITKEIDAQLEKRALTYYQNAEDGLSSFDRLFVENAEDTLSYLVWLSAMPSEDDFDDLTVYAANVEGWQSARPEMKTSVGEDYISSIEKWQSEMPEASSFTSVDELQAAMAEWQSATPATQENAVVVAYAAAVESLQEYLDDRSAALGYEADQTDALELLGSVMYTLDPNGAFDEFYTDNGETAPEDYDVMSLISHIGEGDAAEYLTSAEREDYRTDRACHGASVFLAGNMTERETVDTLLEALSDYGVTPEKYDTFGYTYASIRHMAKTAIVTYRGRLDYELELLLEEYGDESDTAYIAAAEAKRAELAESVSMSFLSTLPSEVSDALEEIGQADLYTLIVGSIFYKLAGLLLPIIYMIMASNNLISGQVDSGSMAYVLSTSTKRSTVVFTQAVYLIGSLLAMFSLTTATGCVCLSLVTEEVELTYKNLVLLNLGAFLVLFALSGLCFFTSCVFDRSKRSMAIGGGLSIFALVAAMLGLFGSPVIPSVVRLDALNHFNYATVISLFDVISIIDGTNVFIGKFVILAFAGLLGYISGSFRFTQKDLPL